MHDAGARLHPVHCAWADRLFRTKTIPVQDFAFQQIGDGRQIDMRVRAHIDALIGQEFSRAHLVEKDEGADHLALLGWKGASYFHFSEIDGAWDNHGLDGIDRCAVAKGGVGAWAPAHVTYPFAGLTIEEIVSLVVEGEDLSENNSFPFMPASG